MPLNLQESFNKAVVGLSTQGFRRSMRQPDESGYVSESCAFRGQDGLKCALGQLIDTKVLMSLPGYSKTESELAMYRVKEAIGAVSIGERGFLDDLVGAHDGGRTPEQMVANLKDVARCYSLRLPPELDGFGTPGPSIG